MKVVARGVRGEVMVKVPVNIIGSSVIMEGDPVAVSIPVCGVVVEGFDANVEEGRLLAPDPVLMERPRKLMVDELAIVAVKVPWVIGTLLDMPVQTS